jgi:hypothetical protein
MLADHISGRRRLKVASHCLVWQGGSIGHGSLSWTPPRRELATPSRRQRQCDLRTAERVERDGATASPDQAPIPHVLAHTIILMHVRAL